MDVRPSIIVPLVLLAVYASRSTAAPGRPTPPTRDPHTPGFVEATELPDGAVPPADADGNFIIGPTHEAAAEAVPHDGVPKGKTFEFTMNSEDSKIYPGIAPNPTLSARPIPTTPPR